ncbi:MAG: magnesium transporter [Candidatus Aenigmatarchaeota archaeon]
MLFTKDFREIGIAEIISMSGGLLVGVMMAFMTNKIAMLPGFLILFPGFMEMRGNISASISSRLSSGLFLHVVKPKMRKNNIIKGNIIASIILAIVIGLFLGLVAYFATAVFGFANIKILFIAVAAAIFSTIIEVPLTIAATLWLFKRGHDPNNIMGPYVTTVGDVVSVVSLLMAMVII